MMIASRNILPRLLTAFSALCLFSVIGLSQACAKPTEGEVLLGKLEEKGFFKYAGGNAEKVRAEIKDKGWPALFGDSGRVYNADGLSLAKGGATKFIEKLRPFLEGQGVKLPALADDLQQTGAGKTGDDRRVPQAQCDGRHNGEFKETPIQF